MSYRDELEAARARAKALEEEVGDLEESRERAEALEQQLREAARKNVELEARLASRARAAAPDRRVTTDRKPRADPSPDIGRLILAVICFGAAIAFFLHAQQAGTWTSWIAGGVFAVLFLFLLPGEWTRR